jgi:hypothetical protein
LWHPPFFLVLKHLLMQYSIDMKTLSEKEKKEIALLHIDRYAIYETLGRKVSFESPDSGKTVSGCVKEVRRNIFDNTIELVLPRKTYSFPEPDMLALTKNQNRLVMVYGDVLASDIGDDDLFEAARESHYTGDTFHEVVNRSGPGAVNAIFISLLS